MSDARLEARLPFDTQTLALGDGPVGLVVVDAGVGFTREGNLADPTHMVPMVRRIDAEFRALRAAVGDALPAEPLSLDFADENDLLLLRGDAPVKAKPVGLAEEDSVLDLLAQLAGPG